MKTVATSAREQRKPMKSIAYPDPFTGSLGVLFINFNRPKLRVVAQTLEQQSMNPLLSTG